MHAQIAATAYSSMLCSIAVLYSAHYQFTVDF